METLPLSRPLVHTQGDTSTKKKKREEEEEEEGRDPEVNQTKRN